MSTVSDAAAPAVTAASVGRTRLGVVVFTAGAATLATEIAASRLLAPYFGSSTIVWANIIGLILLYLSIGYWLGGKVADRHPEPRLLGGIILVAALAVAVTPFIARPILDVALQGLDAVSVGAVVGSFFAALALFAVPITLLGAVAPFAIRLALVDVSQAGAVAGPALRALDGREHRGDLPLGDRDHPAPRHAADDARLGRPPRPRRRAPAREPLAAPDARRRRGSSSSRPGRSRRAPASSTRRSPPTSTSRSSSARTGRAR